MHCAEPVERPAVRAWAYGRPVAAVCEPCVLADTPTVLRRLRIFVQLRYPDYYEDPAIGYSYRDGPIAQLAGDLFVSRPA